MESYYNCHLKYLIHKRNWKLGHFLLKLQCNPNNSPLSYSYHGQPCLIHVWIEINWSWVWVQLGGCSHFFGQSSLPCEMKMHEEHFITHRQCVSIGWAFPINTLNCLKNNKARKKTWCILKDRSKIKTVKNICTRGVITTKATKAAALVDFWDYINYKKWPNNLAELKK